MSKKYPFKVKIEKVLTIADINRLRGAAGTATHLARYDDANMCGAGSVLEVACTHCSAKPGADCNSAVE